MSKSQGVEGPHFFYSFWRFLDRERGGGKESPFKIYPFPNLWSRDGSFPLPSPLRIGLCVCIFSCVLYIFIYAHIYAHVTPQIKPPGLYIWVPNQGPKYNATPNEKSPQYKAPPLDPLVCCPNIKPPKIKPLGGCWFGSQI